ncbi:hypothetical protein D3C77_545850 [compost metagenome]
MFPDRRGTWIGDGPRHRVDQAEGCGGGAQRLALLDQVTAVEQALDNPGTGRFGADAGGVLELLLEAWIVHQLGHVFHGLDQVAFSKGLGRLGPLVFEVDLGHDAVLALMQGGQHLCDRRFTAFGWRQRLRQGTAPTRFDDLFAHRAQGLACTVEVGLGAVVLMVRQELRQIASSNQGVDRFVFWRQT